MRAVSYFLIGLLFSSSVNAHLPIQGVPESDASEQGWQVATSMSLLSVPSYMGDDQNTLNIIPDVRLSYNDVFTVSLLGGISYKAFESRGWEFGPIAKYHLGRPANGENPLLVSGDETQDLIGLGDVEANLEVGVFANYVYEHIQLSLVVRNGTGGHRGLVSDFGFSLNGFMPIGKIPFIYSVGPSFSYMGKRYLNAFFAVDALQSQASGLAEYKLKSGGYSYGLVASGVVPISSKVTIVSFFRYSQLDNNIADSSLVSERGSKTQVLLGASISYTF